MTPLVSVITATYNNAANLRKIMKQVSEQTYPAIEYIIVDGASADDTGQALKEAAELFGSRVTIISEPDHGIYSAINKGIRAAKGEIIGCCFDEYADRDVISRMVALMEREQTDGVHGDLYYRKDGKIIRKWHQGQGKIRFGWLPGHPTFYVRRNIYEQYGLYREDYRVSADYEFMVRCLKDGRVKLSYLPEILIYMEYGGTSNSSLSAYLCSLREGHRALKENGVAFAWFTDICRTCRVLLQFIQ